MSQALAPVVNQAKAVIEKTDAADFLDGLLALTPLTEGKTTDQLTQYSVTSNPDGTLRIQVNFKP